MKPWGTALLCFLTLLAAPLAAHAQGKIGVIKLDAAMLGTAEGKKAAADLRQKYLPRQQELDRLQKEIQVIQDQLTKSPPVRSDGEQRQWQRDLADKQRAFKRMTDDTQSDLAADRDEAIRRIGEKMVRVIADYAQQNGFSLVMDRAKAPLYYAAANIDLTDEIVKRYNAAYPAAGAGASAQPATRPGSPLPAPKSQ